jgi:hypothetical protein
MKAKLSLLLLVLFYCNFSQAAHFEYYQGRFSANCYNYSEDYYYYSGPYNVNNTGTGDLTLEDYSGVLQASSLSRSSLVSNTGSNSIFFSIRTISASMSLDSVGYANCSSKLTTQYSNELGCYYKIMPDTGEVISDKVRVYFEGSFYVEPTGALPATQQGYLKGSGSMNHLSITLNQLPPVTVSPAPDKEIWKMDNLVLNDYFYYGFEDIKFFDCQIGDVLGFFLTC